MLSAYIPGELRIFAYLAGRYMGEVSVTEYETDSFERIQSSPSPLAGDHDPVQFGLVGQNSEANPVQSNPLSNRRLVEHETTTIR